MLILEEEEEEEEEEKFKKEKKKTGEGGIIFPYRFILSAARRDTTASKSSDVSSKAPKAGKKGKSKGKGKGKRSNPAPPDDDEDDLFGKSTRPGDGDDDMFAARGGGMFSSSNGLFDDDEDDDNEGGLFADTEKPKQKTKARTGSMFDNDDEEEDEKDDMSIGRKPSDAGPRTQSGKQLPKGAVSIFGDGGDFLASSKVESSGTHSVRKPTAQNPAKKAGGGGGGGLFDDDEEDDLFGGASVVKSEAAPKAKPASKTQPAKKKVDLFADNDDEEDDLFGSMAAPTGRSKTHSNVGLTVEGYDEEKEVEEKKHQDEEKMRKASVEKKLPAGAVSLFGKGPNPMVAALRKKQGLPSNSEEEDKQEWSDNEDRRSRGSSNQFGSTPSLSGKPPLGSGGGGGGIFADDEDDSSNLFSAGVGGGR
ncbi:WASH complex subunit FAM21A [Elysia marginata]|uniref:WASH complex subunit FAM21A n=1 Tax=Elysia marginata TaxID=1093978 RepID=A0AAV4II72_9GAST|nr:WASH complex subunit FAM21A [Elysia marginata]